MKSQVAGKSPPYWNPRTPEQRAKWAEEWSDWAVEHLLALGEYYPKVAERVCKKVADAFGQDDKLGPVMMKRLKLDRQGKTKKRAKKWTYGRLYQLLLEYSVQVQDGRLPALRMLAEKHGVSPREIEERISEARRLIPTSDLPEWATTPPKKSSRRAK